MSARSKVIEVLMLDGWHEVVPGSYRSMDTGVFVFLEGTVVDTVGVGAARQYLNPVRVSGPTTSILAIREVEE